MSAANEPVKYLLRGGPKDGETVEAPPGYLHEVAEEIAGALGRVAGGKTAAKWREVIEGIGAEHGARPEEVSDERWEAVDVDV